MEAPSFVSKARTAFHSAAAKAERVLSDFKPDRDSDKQLPRDSVNQADDESSKPQTENETKSHHESNKHLRWNPVNPATKQEWQDRFKNIRLGRKFVEDTEKGESTGSNGSKEESTIRSFPVYDDNLYRLNIKDDLEAKAASARLLPNGLSPTIAEKIPSTSVLKHLAIAVESGKNHMSIKDLIMSRGDSSPAKERAALSLSAVKSLVLREKDENGDDEKDASLLQSLFNLEGNFLRRKVCSDSEVLAISSLPRDIHGSPPESFVVKLSEVIGSFKTLRKMASFWCKVVAELSRHWSQEQHLPGIPLDEVPDLNCCLLYQQLQVINCCVSRKRRRAAATEALEYVIREAKSNAQESGGSDGSASLTFYARISSGEPVLRLGAGCQSDLSMLETGEPLYSPVTQEGPLLTEDLIKETEEFVLRTGSVGAGCSQLLSDMQAFKAANPGCILEDFVRWHSPPDWTEIETTSETKESFDGGDPSGRGQLSSRMQKEGNLWLELWETAKPVPAVKQAPLFDEDLAVEGILNMLEDISPAQLFEQLFVSLFGLGFVMAEAMLSTDSNLSKLFYECKDYAIATYQGSSWVDKIDDLCQVYETVEKMVVDPDEVIKMVKHPEAPASAAEPKRRFGRLNLNFGKHRQAKKQASKEQDGVENPMPRRQAFANFLEGKSSLFSKKPPKSEGVSPTEKRCSSDENDWTIV